MITIVVEYIIVARYMIVARYIIVARKVNTWPSTMMTHLVINFPAMLKLFQSKLAFSMVFPGCVTVERYRRAVK